MGHMADLTSILIVDDEAIILSQLKLFLNQEGILVFTATRATEGLEIYKNEQPAICILDYSIPGMNGLELLSQIKKINPATEVILMSGHADIRIAINAMKEHAFDFLQKPIDLDELLKKIHEVFNLIYLKKKRNEVKIGTLLSYKHLDSSIPISEITINEDLDEITALQFSAELENLLINGYLKPNIIISLAQVHRINNIGLNTLMSIFNRYAAEGYKITLSNLTTEVQKYLHILGYTDYFSILKLSAHPESTFL